MSQFTFTKKDVHKVLSGEKKKIVGIISSEKYM